MGKVDANHAYYESPSTRRAWIEMRMLSASGVTTGTSPSTRRAWIEILTLLERLTSPTAVALHPEGVDRNLLTLSASGHLTPSPSTRRAWIEMRHNFGLKAIPSVALHPEGVDRNRGRTERNPQLCIVALHPEGVDRNFEGGETEVEETEVALHPEGVDRNVVEAIQKGELFASPSTRRAWIEILSKIGTYTPRNKVALHPEGVDRNS